MIALKNDWMVLNPMDFEYKQLAMLSLEQKCNEDLSNGILYPWYDVINRDFNCINKYWGNLIHLKDKFKTIKKIDIHNLKIEYETPPSPETTHFEEVSSFCMPLLKPLYINVNKIHGELTNAYTNTNFFTWPKKIFLNLNDIKIKMIIYKTDYIFETGYITDNEYVDMNLDGNFDIEKTIIPFIQKMNQ